MSIFSSPEFLPRVLWADAASCVASGLVQLAALDALTGLLGLPRGLLLATGVFLLAYGVTVGIVAARGASPRALVRLFALGNAGWAAGCVAVGLLLPVTAWGIAWLAAQGLCVLVLADLQWAGLRASARRGAFAAA